MGQKRKIPSDVSSAVSESTANGGKVNGSFDPVLASLFASSLGPVKVSKWAPAPRKADQQQPTVSSAEVDRESSGKRHDEVKREPTDLNREDTSERSAVIAQPRLTRKRRKLNENQDLESSYWNRLAREEARDQRGKSPTRDGQTASLGKVRGVAQERADFSGAQQEGEHFDVPIHESLANVAKSGSADKATRTVFLGNVSINAIKSKSARRELMVHLTSAVAELEKDGPGARKIESLRFRSTAFVSDAGPKRAAYAKKELMENTTTSTNAYVVYSTKEAARQAAAVLNGTVVLDRHLRADYVGQPTRVDHKRCVFVGNLSFVDKETRPEDGHAESEQKPRPKATEAADAEEGLWRTFSKAGQVESVRVVRDKETRVGKGFAYVQFTHENGVEAALLLNDKKFPPMLPRKLRVVRAKRTKKKMASLNDKPTAKHLSPNRVGSGSDPKTNRSRLTNFKVLGDRDHQRLVGNGKSFVFEGHRATNRSLQKSDRAKSAKRSKQRPMTRSSRRGAAFKAGGRKKSTASSG